MEDKLNQAIIYATKKHEGQVRKGTVIPYIVHPIETMNILVSMKADTTLRIAGVLHDVVEDTDATMEEIRELFGAEAAELIGCHSEDKSKTWKERKETDIQETLAGTRSLKMLVMADKVANLRDLYRDVQDVKEKVWERFNASKEMQSWYYSKMIDALEEMQFDEDTEDIYWEMNNLFKDIFVQFYYQDMREMMFQVCLSGEVYFFDARDLEWKVYEQNLPDGMERITRQCAEQLEEAVIKGFLSS